MIKMTRFIFTLAMLVSTFAVTANDYQTSARYEPIIPEQPTQTGEKIEVVELFWYGCPHCYHFEPHVQNWLKQKPEYVTFRRIPAIFRESWMPHARAYFALEQMDKVEDGHSLIFNAMHRDKKRLNTREQIADLLDAGGINRELFLQQYDSFTTESKVRQAALMTRRYGIRGVPAVIIQGKYRTSGSIAGSFENAIKVINELVDKEHKGK